MYKTVHTYYLNVLGTWEFRSEIWTRGAISATMGVLASLLHQPGRRAGGACSSHTQHAPAPVSSFPPAALSFCKCGNLEAATQKWQDDVIASLSDFQVAEFHSGHTHTHTPAMLRLSTTTISWPRVPRGQLHCCWIWAQWIFLLELLFEWPH